MEIRIDISLVEQAHASIPWLFVGLSEFPPETRHVLQVDTWRPRGVNLSTTTWYALNTWRHRGVKLLPPTKHLVCFPPHIFPSGQRCPKLWRPRLWQDVGIYRIAFSRWGLKLFLFSRKSHPAS